MIRNEGQRQRWLLLTALCVALATLGILPVASGNARSSAATGTLALRGALSVESRRGDFCPAGTPSTVECFSRQGKGVVPGLGRVSETYLYRVDTAPAGCPAGAFRVLATTVRFTVSGKGGLDFAVPESTRCLLSVAEALAPTYPPFTIVSGSGAYAGATGSGTLRHTLSPAPIGAVGTDTWSATLEVPGLEFDVAPPTLSGAVAKSVRVRRGAKSARVTFTVTARDATDGAVPASCRPKSGSVFKLGRTVVSCSTEDSSGNTRKANFPITVKSAR